MILDFDEYKLIQFDRVAQMIIDDPSIHMSIEHVSDFYKLPYLDLFPSGTQWYCSGLDDGATSFYATIQYKNRRINLHYDEVLMIGLEVGSTIL